MLIQCQFKNSRGDGWTEKTCAYRCDIPVQVGDLVEVPNKDGPKVVRVAEVDVPETSIASNVLPLLKTVIGPAEYDGTIFDVDPDAPADNVPALPEIEFAENLIVIQQLPIIQDQLRSYRAEVEAKVNEAMSLAVTEDTVKVVKKVKADLNKEAKLLEDRRKQVKTAIMEPYNQFEATYRECIGDLYTKADKDLKEKIDAVENSIKDEKKKRVVAYYEEYRASIDLQNEEAADIRKWPMNITKTESEKSIRMRAKAYLDTIRQSLIAIAGGMYPDEMLVEFRMYGDLAKATAIVNERHRKMEEEKQRREAEAAAKAEREAREREAMAKVDAAMQNQAPPAPAETMAPPVQSKPAKDPNQIFPVFAFRLINETRARILSLRKFLDDGGYHYE